MSTSASSIFTGSSQFSTSLAAMVQKAVAAASAPITQLASRGQDLSTQKDEVSTLNSKFSALQSAIEQIDSAANASFSASVSDPLSIGASLGSGATEGHYSVEVIDAGAKSTMMTAAWDADPGDPKTYKLWIGGAEYGIIGADNSAQAVAQAINASYGHLVSATAVNVGSTESPDYRISLLGKALSSDALDLRSDGVSLVAIQENGRAAQYEVNGSGNTVSSSSANISIAEGVNLTLLAESSGAVNINVTRSSSALTSAISSFVSAYNAAVDGVAGQRGQAGGALRGQFIVSELSQSLGRLVTYSSSSGGVSGLRSLGVTLGQDGHLTVDYSKLRLKDLFDSGSVNAFLGSAPGTSSTSGSGFLQSATSILGTIADPVSGLLPRMQSGLKSQIASIQVSIAKKQAQVDRMQEALINRLALNDAAIASMEQQFTFFSAMFDAMQSSQSQYA